ncbi:putative transposase [Colwellia chukchiensis]|uniref:Putative transposase n=1 Tax=Colwellia chukchiensis TaxID=641665 RepID=A0A1H7IYX5_9GAMM|nr:DDE-type integrase/transposase/recombinase [Colwellia chukchiensis]SEK67608.1 putative transposase [Colwellia chukchiensis]
MASYNVGDFIIKDDHQYQITNINKQNFVFLEDTFTNAKLKYSKRDLNDLLFLGRAEVVSSDPRYNDLHSENAKDFHSYSEEDKKIARDRFKFVRAFQESGIKGCSNKKPIRDLIADVAMEIGHEIISWRTLKRWVDQHDVYGIRGLVPQTKKKGNRKPRKPNKIEELIVEALEEYKNKTRPTFTTAHEYLSDQIILHNKEIDDGEREDERLPSFSYQSFILRAKKIAPASLLEAYVGKSEASKKNRVSRKPDEALYILDRAEIDHTTGDCFVVDDVTALPLGRPYVSAVLDKKSECILGCYIGFESPSFVSVARAMKHAISDKSAFLKQFSSVEGDWPCRGAFIEIAYDRGKEFDSDLLEDALYDLNITGRGNPAGMPWYKGAVESFFYTLNKKFLDNKPGKVFSNLFVSNEYDPEKNAVISLSDFLEAFYVWVVDVYMRSPHGKDKVVPYAVWKLEEKYVDIEPIPPKKLDLALSENKTRTNRGDGIVWDTIKYDNGFLLALRKQYGNQLLTCKRNREDLSVIHVLNPADEKFYPVEAVDQEYTKGLTYFQNNICRRYRDKLAKESTDEVSLALARQKIREIFNNSVLSSRKKKLAHSKAAARFNDLGQNKVGENTLVNSSSEKSRPSKISTPKGDITPPISNSEFLAAFKDKNDGRK